MIRRAQSVLLGIGASVALAGCAVGPNYERPTLPTPPAYRFVEAPVQIPREHVRSSVLQSRARVITAKRKRALPKEKKESP